MERDIRTLFGIERPVVQAGMVWVSGGKLAAAAAEAGDRAAVERHVETQRRFLRDHLLAWAPECLSLVVVHARTTYYRGIARLTLGSLEESAMILGLGRAPLAH